MLTRKMTGPLVACLAALVSLPVFADWAVDPAASHVGFGSVKNNLIAENHSFTQVAGGITSAGQATIVINLASVETMIPIRNERMQEILFKVAEFPAATITADVDVTRYAAMKAGDALTDRVSLKINLHGNEVNKAVPVKVVRSGSQTFDVASLGPILVHASQFGLSDGVDSLRKIAGLQSIDLTVPVTFNLRLIGQGE